MRRSILCALATLALAAPTAAPADAVVHTLSGDVAGASAAQVESFKGIPFAAPPVGPLRWRPPAPAPRWPGVRAAASFGPSCTQSQRAGRAPLPTSEDCLTLNVWRPAGTAPGARLPVMVWIYGGAFVMGASAFPVYDGAHFADDGVILVSFNYRLGRLGFFAHPALDAGPEPAGNYGLMDQIAALEWVRDNIAAFGGDPARVTVFGESAGAVSVNYLMGSPLARGLFARALAESGFGRSKALPMTGAGSAESVGEAFASAHGIAGDGPAAAAALRALPAQALIGDYGGLGSATMPAPMIDGRVVTETIAAAFQKGDEARVPFLEGGNSYEASLFPNVADAADAAIARAGPPAEVEALYGGKPAPEVARELLTDRLITEPDRCLARLMARQGLTAYVYEFSYQPLAMRAESFGAAHGFEVPYVFDNLPQAPVNLGTVKIPAASADDEAIARAVHAYWVAFAKTGDPKSAGGPAWPRFAGGDGAVMSFADDGVSVVRGFEKARLDLLERAAERAGPAP